MDVNEQFRKISLCSFASISYVSCFFWSCNCKRFRSNVPGCVAVPSTGWLVGPLWWSEEAGCLKVTSKSWRVSNMFSVFWLLSSCTYHSGGRSAIKEWYDSNTSPFKMELTGYHEVVHDHFNNPRNVGSLDKEERVADLAWHGRLVFERSLWGYNNPRDPITLSEDDWGV